MAFIFRRVVGSVLVSTILGLPAGVQAPPETYDEVVDISDAIAHLGFLFVGNSEPAVIEAADINGDTEIDISDPIYLLAYLFAGGPPPPAPFPDLGPAL
jgi:hypothetical protein